jgi:hypothetical protein
MSLSTKVTPVSNNKDDKEVQAASLETAISKGARTCSTTENNATETNSAAKTLPTCKNSGAYAVYLESNTHNFYVVENGVIVGSFGTCLPSDKICVRVAGQEDYLRRMFADYDTNGDGTIDLDELKMLLEEIFFNGGVLEFPLSNDDLERILNSLDSDGNGTVDIDEWVTWLRDGMANPRTRRTMLRSRDSLDNKLGILLAVVATLYDLEICLSFYVGDDRRYVSHRISKEKFVDLGSFCLLGGDVSTGVEKLRWVSRTKKNANVESVVELELRLVDWEDSTAQGIVTSGESKSGESREDKKAGDAVGVEEENEKAEEATLVATSTIDIKRRVRQADERSAVRSKELLVGQSAQCPTIGVEFVIGMEYVKASRVLCGLHGFDEINTLDGMTFPAVSEDGTVAVVAPSSDSSRTRTKSRTRLKIAVGVLILLVVVGIALAILFLAGIL